ncbi:MAG: S8 family serine peptidase, partial [Clostridiales bacterium]|nr:S8 family serine peptidase [Clostridiales bacterium]
MNIKRKYQQLKKITATILLATFFITSTSMPALAQDIYQKYQEQKKWRDILNADLSNNQADLPGAASGQAAGQESETTVPEAEMGIAVSDSYLAEQALQKYPATRFIVKYNDDYLEKLMAEEEAKSLSNEKKDIPNSKNNKNGKSGRRSFYASADRKTLRKVQDTIAASLENELNEEASVEMVDGYAILEIIEKKTALEVWKNIPTKDNVEYIQPDYEMEVSAIDNPLPSATPFGEGGKEGGDPDLSKQWGHYQLYHPEKQLPYRMDAAVTDAWLQSTGKGAIVAVLDTGIDINHPDLKASIWQNPNNNTDKGFAGDINGWDFFNNDNTVNDVEWKYDQWHSTHIAGIIAAQKDNGIGIAGVAPDAKIMPLKVFQGGTAYTSDIIAAIHYAEENGARIVNCSWGSRYENLALKEVIEASNMLFVCAAGNNGYNIDNYPVYPAAFDLGNVISVASINEDGRMSRFSNYGTISTDIAAPGNNIYSCWLDNGYNRLSGTSFAAAYVSGAAALLVGKNSDMTGAEMKARLLDSADTVIGLMDKVAGSKKLNCAYAVSGATVANTSVIDVADEAMPVRVPSYMAVADEDEYELYNAENYISYAQSLPHIRYGAIAIESNGKIYLCGGVARDFAGHSITANLLTYDHVSDTWTEGPEMDKSNYISPVAVAYNGKLYSFLGTSVGIYDPTINKWTDTLTIKGGASIPDLSAPSVVVDPINEKIYVVGGVLYINGRYVAQNTVYEYSIATNTLVALPNLSVSTGSASTIFYEGKIYFSTYFESYFGIEMAQYVYNIDTGSTMPAVNKLMDGICLASNDRAICIGQMFITGIGQTGIIKQFNLKTVDDPNAVYTSITHSFNEYRTDFATVIAYGKLYIIGGSDVSVEVMDLGWSEKAPLPVQLKDFRTIEMDGSIYVLGGTENVTGIDQVSKKVHAYDPQTNVWQPKADMPIYAKDFALAYSGYGKM